MLVPLPMALLLLIEDVNRRLQLVFEQLIDGICLPLALGLLLSLLLPFDFGQKCFFLFICSQVLNLGYASLFRVTLSRTKVARLFVVRSFTLSFDVSSAHMIEFN